MYKSKRREHICLLCILHFFKHVEVFCCEVELQEKIILVKIIGKNKKENPQICMLSEELRDISSEAAMILSGKTK